MTNGIQSVPRDSLDRAVSKSVVTFEPFTALERTRTRSELKIVTGFLQRLVHFRSRYVRTFKRVQIRSCIESALS